MRQAILILVLQVMTMSFAAHAGTPADQEFRCSLKMFLRGNESPVVDIRNHRVVLNANKPAELNEAFAGLSQYLRDYQVVANLYFVVNVQDLSANQQELQVSIYRYNAHKENRRELVHQAGADAKGFAKLVTAVDGDYTVNAFTCRRNDAVRAL